MDVVQPPEYFFIKNFQVLFLLDLIPMLVTFFELSCDSEMDATLLTLNLVRALSLLSLIAYSLNAWRNRGDSREFLRSETDVGHYDMRLESGVGENPTSAQ